MFQTTNQMNMSISYVFNYSSGWDMEWNGMEWHGLRHILKNLMVELLTIGFKYYLVLVLSFLQGSAWNSQQTISVWTTEWTFKKSYLMMSSQPQHGVSMTSASSLLVDNQCSESIPPMLQQHTYNSRCSHDHDCFRTTKWHLINPNSKMLPRAYPYAAYALGASPWHSSN